MARADREQREYAKQFGLRVVALREQRGWTQAKLAELADVHLNQVGKVERGLALCSVYIADKLARALKVRADVLMPAPGADPSPEQAALQDLVRSVGKADAARIARVVIEAYRYRHGEPPRPSVRKKRDQRLQRSISSLEDHRSSPPRRRQAR